MSQENVEIVRDLFQKVGRGENPEALYEILDPEVEFDLSRTNLLEMQGVHIGHAAVREFFRRWAGTWERWEFGPEEVIGAGDRVVVILREQAMGKGKRRPGEDSGRANMDLYERQGRSLADFC